MKCYEPINELADATRDMRCAIASLVQELEAVDPVYITEN